MLREEIAKVLHFYFAKKETSQENIIIFSKCRCKLSIEFYDKQEMKF